MLTKLPARCLYCAGLAVFLLMPSADAADVEPPGDVRTEITADSLLNGTDAIEQPVHNAWFMPVGEEGPALEEFSGDLILGAMRMQVEPAFESDLLLGGDLGIFPGVTLAFFSDDGVLIPATQEIIRAPADQPENSFWQIIVQPGRVWSEAADDGWSRGSFPFALMNELENDTHNGIATFLYNGDSVSDVRFQIVQQTAPYFIGDHFTAWGQLAANIEPVALEDRAQVIEAYQRELADRFPVADWSELEQIAGPEALAHFEGSTNPDFRVISGLVVDGVLYHKPSSTPWGDYPYARDMRFGIWSMTKSIGPTLGMLRLAQKYGPEVFDLKIIDYVTINPDHDGWDDVTFGDALDMATGVGGGNTDRTASMFVNYGYDGYATWYAKPSVAEKISEIEKTGNFPWGPGEVARYRDRDMFLLGVAMDAYLKSQEGPDADIWTMIAEEVFQPIGIHHAPMNRTVEPDGSLGVPIMVWGYYPNLDDLVKIANLYHHHGSHDGEQLLHPELAASLFSSEGTFDQHRSVGIRRYKMGFHFTSVVTPASNEEILVPYMAGWVGNRVVLLPDDMTAIRISKAWPAYDHEQAAASNPLSMIRAGMALRGIVLAADDGEDVTLIDRTNVTPPGDVRTEITVDSLLNGTDVIEQPVHNAWFMPVGEAGPALHDFSGTITFHPSAIEWFDADGQHEDQSSGFELSFVTHGDHLIPADAGFILTDDEEYLTRFIISPGRVWSEPSDGGLSRASFPFVQASPYSNEAYNGLMTFVFDGEMVSNVQAQIVQETAAGYEFVAFGRLETTYERHALANEQAVIADFEQDLATRLPVRPFADLEEGLRSSARGAFSGARHSELISSSGIIMDGVIYLRPCETDYGDFPYCEDMRHGVFSVTKSLGGLVSMLYLAQRYGDDVFDLKIKDYVDVTAEHGGWEDVTFADALNMATGIGEHFPDPSSRVFMEEDMEDPRFLAFIDELPASGKLGVSFSRPDYPWGPGEVFRYTSLDTFVLAAAMDAFVKSREGADANLWDLVTNDVLRPIGIMTLPMRHTVEHDGSRGIPNLWAGTYPNVHDVAKITTLLHDDGRHGDQQLLSQTKLDEALYRTDVRGLAFGGSSEKSYYMSLWHALVWVPSCAVDAPYMAGLGGNMVILLPEGLTVFYFADNFLYDHEALVEAANEIRPLCPE